MATHTITAFFDSRTHADQAVVMLKQAGIPAADITLLPPVNESGTYDSVDEKGKGFWASLEDLFGGTEDHASYAEGLRRGGTMVSVRASDPDVDRTIDILEQHGSVDLDERETQWRSEGWTAETPLIEDRATTSGLSGITGLGAAAVGATSPALASYDERRDVTLTSAVVEPGLISAPVVTVADTKVSSLAPSTVSGEIRTGGDELIQIVEERLDVGKRAVSRGKVRISSRVVERAVTENITLHSETLTVDRHAVDRPVALGALGIDPFKERVIEMEEIDEEAVVAKSARVVEEINLRKDAADRVETIHDTVRSTKVDVEDGRSVTASGLKTTGLVAYEGLIEDNMDVVGSDGGHIGTVDHLDGSKIKLKKNDSVSGGQHHFVPMDWIKSVEGKVMLQIPAAEAMNRWSDVA